MSSPEFVFQGNPGPTHTGERGSRVGMAGAEQGAFLESTKLYLFETFTDKHFCDTVVGESNKYHDVASLDEDHVLLPNMHDSHGLQNRHRSGNL